MYGPQCDEADDMEEAIVSAGEKIPEATDSAGETRSLYSCGSRGMLRDCRGTPLALDANGF